MRNFIIYIFFNYIILIGLIVAVSLLVCHSVNNGLELKVIAATTLFITPGWILLSCCNKMTFFKNYMGYHPISIKQIKKKIDKNKEYFQFSYVFIWGIHILLTIILGCITVIFVFFIFPTSLPIYTVGAILMTLIYFYSIIYFYYVYGYKFHKSLGNKFTVNNFVSKSTKALRQCDIVLSQEIGKYYLSQKLDYKNGYRWFFLTWFSAKIPIPVELQQYIDSRDKALINLFRPDPNAEDPLEKALFPLWAYIYWTLIGNDDDAREKYYQEAAKIGFDDTQWQLFYPKQISATA